MSKQMQLSQIELEEPVVPGTAGNYSVSECKDIIVILIIIAVFP